MNLEFSSQRRGRDECLIPTPGRIDLSMVCVDGRGFCGSDASYSLTVGFVCPSVILNLLDFFPLLVFASVTFVDSKPTA